MTKHEIVLTQRIRVVRGKQGQQGPQGERGERGPMGLRGLPGEQGEQGMVGPRGFRGPEGPAGRDGLGFTWRNDWKRGVVYAKNDCVRYRGSSYIAVRETENEYPRESGGAWSILALKGDEGARGPKGSKGEKGDSTFAFGGGGHQTIQQGGDAVTPYEVQIDDAGSGVTYVGEADPGSSAASAVWRIKRITESGSPTDTSIEWADGTAAFTKVWNDRATYSYS